MKKTIATVLMAFSSFGSVAGEWNQAGKITKVYPKPTRNGIYFTHENMVSGGCTRGTNLFLSADESLFKETYTLLLSAYVTGKPIKIYVDGCQATHEYPLIKEVIAQ
ncbi:hypothetical protein [Pseudoalteromonas sp. McH1-42]|uniref:hypothetical protein n=1 Tax=Pseudoalteromonas sp. McH1-42 TaxID=2917752 RepID=UPI001EF70B6D|nr:hypothetical protein [Pseudoalteromonas sp. McH1-42]MCG7561493.1 hypothetical protein [Pseudoalteromonas sp. McH1-42]